VDHDGPVNHVLPAWDGMAGFLAALAILARNAIAGCTARGSW